MSSPVHIDNKNNDILILSEGPAQGFDDTTLKTEEKWPIKFTQSGKRFVLALNSNGSKSFLTVSQQFQLITWKNRIKKEV